MNSQILRPVTSQSKARLYANVNLNKNQEYYDYENLKIDWGHQENYEVLRKIGRGKYADIFAGINIVSNEKVVIKALKPIKKQKIRREIKILRCLQGSCSIPRIFDVIEDKPSKTISLILEYFENQEYKTLMKQLTDFEVRYYMYELLKTLDYAHSHGIMHRDIKPNNIMIDHSQRKLALIDWGLSEFYVPGTPYHCRVGTRYYKAPELLFNYQYYDYSLDMWAFGTVFAGIIFQKEPFFHGHDNLDQIVKIIRVLGTETLRSYIDKFDLEIEPQLEEAVGLYPKRGWNKFIDPERKELAGPEAIDLLSHILRYDHEQRTLPSEAMRHEYFEPVREMWKQVKAGVLSYDSESSEYKTGRILIDNPITY
ncbi:unnamed protein product [Blepharisma stoltei]|uniref:non-specific serine/threonine protein kinase n=1 Tax=Blepharisma stoltei TaxID=1481888 RepID=A0AAU9JES7_9CILI|nr:unnamed protein product [Blepharisma stoltei]